MAPNGVWQLSLNLCICKYIWQPILQLLLQRSSAPERQTSVFLREMSTHVKWLVMYFLSWVVDLIHSKQSKWGRNLWDLRNMQCPKNLECGSWWAADPDACSPVWLLEPVVNTTQYKNKYLVRRESPGASFIKSALKGSIFCLSDDIRIYIYLCVNTRKCTYMSELSLLINPTCTSIMLVHGH